MLHRINVLDRPTAPTGTTRVNLYERHDIPSERQSAINAVDSSLQMWAPNISGNEN